MKTHTPPTIARMLGIKVDKVHTWIRAGDLKAVNVAQKRSGRPRWRILDEQHAAFHKSLDSRSRGRNVPAAQFSGRRGASRDAR